jgi:hypothetical protein
MDVKPEGIKTQQPTLKLGFEPWDLQPATKRDCSPDRTALLTGLAWFSTAAASLYVFVFPILVIVPILVLEHKKDRHDPLKLSYSLLCLIPPLMAIASALITRSIAANDLKRMWTGDMDRRALHAARKAWSRSRTALWITLLGPLGWIAAGALLYAHYLVSVFGPKALMRRGFSDFAPLAWIAISVLLYVIFLVSIFRLRDLIRRGSAEATPNRPMPDINCRPSSA